MLSSEIVNVWPHNLMSEFSRIDTCVSLFPYVSIDTEFPGIVYHQINISKHSMESLSPAEFYAVMKRNVDALKLIQLGLTLSSSDGRSHYSWEFNFRDFDSDHDLQNPESVSFLKRQGIDFLKNKQRGIESWVFAVLFRRVFGVPRKNLKWATFHGPYDLGFLVKILTGMELPESLDGFMMLVRGFFGDEVYDLKNVVRDFGLGGGLEGVARSLNLERVTGKRHKAGSDSLMIMRVFFELKGKCSEEEMNRILQRFKYKLYGLS
ncbi:hypothetical protein ACP275_14G100300 [Erythranthe tilingii]